MGSLRHTFLMWKLETALVQDFAISAVQQAHQEELPGTPLPTGFPFRSELAEIGYTAKEDLDGSTTWELMNTVGLGESDAQAVLDAWAKL